MTRPPQGATVAGSDAGRMRVVDDVVRLAGCASSSGDRAGFSGMDVVDEAEHAAGPLVTPITTVGGPCL
jgi:hypothetical protein